MKTSTLLATLVLALVLSGCSSKKAANALPPSYDFAGVDTDHDGKISHDELHRAGMKKFHELAKKKPDSIRLAECGKQGKKWCRAADTDKNGRVSMKEFFLRLDDDFKQADHNHDGALDPREFEAISVLRF